jgi:hypothetical protein
LLPNFDLIGLQILPPDGPLGNILLHLGYVVVGYTSERHRCTLLELITFSLSRTTVEHVIPGPFHSAQKALKTEMYSKYKIPMII